MKIIRMLPFILFVLLAVLFGIALMNGKNESKSALLQQSLPNFSVMSFSHDRTMMSAQNLQKPSLLVFWASWCGVCKIDLPNLSKFAKDKNIPLYGIAYRDSPALLAQAMNGFGKDVQFTDLGMDKTGEVSAQYGLIGVPTLFAINKAGQIAYVKAGSVSEEELQDDILPALQ